MKAGLGVVFTYLLLTLLWGVILAFYTRYRRPRRDPLIVMLLGVLALDAFKSLVESAYFGLFWGAQYGVLPQPLVALGQPWALNLVKLLNVAVAVTVLVRLVRTWVPSELARREAEAAERALALDRARAAEARLTLVLQAASDVVWDADLVTGDIVSSPQTAQWLGYAPAEWPPKPWHVIVHPDDWPRVKRAIADVIKGKTPNYDLKHRVVKKDGTVLHAHGRGLTTRDQHGRAVRFLGAVRDVTRDVEVDAHRQQAQRLESLGLLAGGIAHDFNNLLAVLSSSIAALERRPGEAAQREATETARLAVTRATTLTRQLLAYAGRAPAELRPVDLNVLLTQMGQLLSVSVSRKVRFERQLAAALPSVKGDEGQLQQVVMNLVTNASEAIGDREGRVLVKSWALPAGAPMPPGFRGEPLPGPLVCFSVQDDGAGMSAETLARIFDPFFSTKGLGRGLGLSALAGILRAHGGGLAIESTVGKGTTFTVCLPALPESPQADTAVPVLTGLRPGVRVLLVDDEPLLRRSAKRLLTMLQCHVTEAETGRQAVEHVTAAPTDFDVVVMDLTMPEMDGAEAARRIGALAPRLPVVLSSGYAATSPTPHPEETTLHLPKPYTFDELEAVLAAATARASS